MDEQNSGKKEKMLTGKMSIKTKLLLLAILPALLVTVILLLIAQKSMNEGMVSESVDSMKYLVRSVEAGMAHVSDGEYSLNADGDLMKGDYNITKDEELIDSFTEGSDCDITLCYKNVRKATSFIDEKTKKRIDYLKNFGFAGETEIVAPGINGKMDEIRSAYGLLNLKQVDMAIESRRQVAIKYREALSGVEGISFMDDMPGVRHNYSYFPIFVDAERYGMTRDELYFKMKEKNVLGRRYFYPLISEFSTYRGLESARPENLPIACQIAERVICLPMYAGLNDEDLIRIITSIC